MRSLNTSPLSVFEIPRTPSFSVLHPADRENAPNWRSRSRSPSKLRICTATVRFNQSKRSRCPVFVRYDKPPYSLRDMRRFFWRVSCGCASPRTARAPISAGAQTRLGVTPNGQRSCTRPRNSRRSMASVCRGRPRRAAPIPPHARPNSRIDGRYRCRNPWVTPQTRNALPASSVGPGPFSQAAFGSAAIELATASLLLPGGDTEVTNLAAANTATRTGGRTRPVSPLPARALGAPHDDTRAESRTGWASPPCEATRSRARPGK